jgi:hypothetical protein
MPYRSRRLRSAPSGSRDRLGRWPPRNRWFQNPLKWTLVETRPTAPPRPPKAPRDAELRRNAHRTRQPDSNHDRGVDVTGERTRTVERKRPNVMKREYCLSRRGLGFGRVGGNHAGYWLSDHRAAANAMSGKTAMRKVQMKKLGIVRSSQRYGSGTTRVYHTLETTARTVCGSCEKTPSSRG